MQEYKRVTQTERTCPFCDWTAQLFEHDEGVATAIREVYCPSCKMDRHMRITWKGKPLEDGNSVAVST